MRAAALFVILAISATIVAGAQCVVACADPATPPPCHHAPHQAPKKAAKSCDSSSVFGEKQPVTILEAPMVGPITASQAPQPPVRTRTGIAAADPRLRPPGGAPPLVLRV